MHWIAGSFAVSTANTDSKCEAPFGEDNTIRADRDIVHTTRYCTKGSTVPGKELVNKSEPKATTLGF